MIEKYGWGCWNSHEYGNVILHYFASIYIDLAVCTRSVTVSTDELDPRYVFEKGVHYSTTKSRE